MFDYLSGGSSESPRLRYVTIFQGKKHQANLARRAAKEAKEQGGPSIAPARPNVPLKKFIKIGRPGYKVTKQRDPATGQQSLLFQVMIKVQRVLSLLRVLTVCWIVTFIIYSINPQLNRANSG